MNMITLIRTEFLKLRRCPILLVGIVAMTLCPPVQLASQYALNEELRNPHFDLPALMNATIWGNAQVFLPISLAMIGGYMMNREYQDDTLKQALCVPVPFGRLIAGKLLCTGLLAACFAVYSFIMTVATGLIAGLSGFGVAVLARGYAQLTVTALGSFIACSPVIVLAGAIPGAYLAGSVAAFLLGYAVLFFKGGLLRNVYPFLAAFAVAGFDTASFNGAKEAASLPMAVLSLSLTAFAAALLVCVVRPPRARERRAKKPRRRIDT